MVELKEKLRNVRAHAEALYSELMLTKTAIRVGCKKEELVGAKVHCPPEKLGEIIGKKGSNVRHLQSSGAVSVNVLKQGDVRILGSLDALDNATANLLKVIDAVEETWDHPPPGLIAYLTSRHITALQELTERHPTVRLSVQRHTQTITMKGLPADLDQLKADLNRLELAVHVMSLSDAEASHVVGKQGATVERLVTSYQVAIDVERRAHKNEKPQPESQTPSMVTVTGPVDRVPDRKSVV